MKGRFGLIGNPLTHSLSPRLHGFMHTIPYELFFDLTPDNALLDPSIAAINVTSPYKHRMYQQCDHVSEFARATQAVNLVLKQGQDWNGYNTDVEGMLLVLQHLELAQDIPVDILGNGSTSHSMLLACHQYGFKSVQVYARHPQQGELSFSQWQPHESFLISTLPAAAWTVSSPPIHVDAIHRQLGVMDVNYVPVHSPLIAAAKRMNIPWMNGLNLLVGQALQAMKYLPIVPRTALDYATLLHQLWKTIPVFLIGMPGSGKSTLGRAWTQTQQRPFIDLDDIITNQTGLPPHMIIQSEGEVKFRHEEKAALQSLSLLPGTIVATGGGTILDPENQAWMQAHGLVIYLQQPPREFIDPLRPLTATPMMYEQVFKQRQPIYQSLADITVHITTQHINEAISLLEEKYERYLSGFWSKFTSTRST